MLRFELFLLQGRFSKKSFASKLKADVRTIQRWCNSGVTPVPTLWERACTILLEAGVSDLSDPWTVTEDTEEVELAQVIRPVNSQPVQVPKTAPQEGPMEIASREPLTLETLAHFGLDEEHDPFQEPEDPEDIFQSNRLIRIERALILAIQRHQIVVVCGPAGSGKSTLLRRLYGRLGKDKRVRLIAPASLDRRRVTHAALSVAIIRDLTGKDTSSLSMEARSELLRTTLEEQDRNCIYPALIIDEAHLLSNDALLAIKQLWDSHTLFRQLGIILIGQELLKARLRTDPAIKELTGRTQIIDLPPMGVDTAEYLRWRFARVGANADTIFDAGAYEALAVRGEHALWINNLASNALRYAHGVGDERVSATHVGRA